MDNKKDRYFSFGAQTGGFQAGLAVGLHWGILSQLLEKYCNYPYSPELKQFSPVLRVDGDLASWNEEGCIRLRLMRKQGYITVDIMMPRQRWEDKSPREIRRFLSDNMKQALQLFVQRLRKEKMQVDDERLFADFTKLEKEYLKMKKHVTQ